MPTNVQRNVHDQPRRAAVRQSRTAPGGGADPRPQGLHRHLTQGKGDIGGALLPPPEGIWGMPPEMLQKLPGYDPDVAKNRAEARKIMEKVGYGPDKRLTLKVSTRNIAPYRDPAVILIDQLKQIYIDAELETDRHHAMVSQAAAQGLHDRRQPDRQRRRRPRPDVLRELCLRFGEQLRRLLQSRDRQADRRSNRWRPTRRSARRWCGRSSGGWPRTWRAPVLYHNRSGTCWQPYVKGYTPMVNSIYNGMRMEDVWLDK